MGRKSYKLHRASKDLGISVGDIVDILEDAKDGRVKKKTKEKINKILEDQSITIGDKYTPDK